MKVPFWERVARALNRPVSMTMPRWLWVAILMVIIVIVDVVVK